MLYCMHNVSSARRFVGIFYLDFRTGVIRMKERVLRKMLMAAMVMCMAAPLALSAAAVSDDGAASAQPVIVQGAAAGIDHVGEYWYDGTWYSQVYIASEDATISGNTFGGVAITEDCTVIIDGNFHQTQPLVMSSGHLIVKGDFYNRFPIEVLGGTVTVEGNFFSEVKNSKLDGAVIEIGKDFRQTGDLDLKGAALTVGGNYYHTASTLDLNGGTLTIGGDYRLQSISTGANGQPVYGTTYGVLKMNDANDHMTVGGACYIQSYYGEGGSYNDLTDGLLELKGDFYQITKDNASSSNFNAYGNHRVTFTGEGLQTVHFDSSNSGFNILTASTNTKIDFTNARISSLDSAVTVTNFIQCGDMTLNGQKLTILDNMIQQGNIYGDGGTLLVKGNYTQVSGTLDLNNADVTIDGDYRLQSIQNNDNGSTSYSTTYGVLKMNDANDHLTIGGTCYIQSYYGEGSSYNNLTDGLLELKGDFYQIAAENASGSNFNARENHRVTFSGDGIQTVHFDGSGSGFNILTASTNTKINFTNARVTSLDSAVTVTNFVQYGDMALNGQKLTVLENFTQQGNVDGDRGTLLVKGNYTQVDGTLNVNRADITIDGNYRLQSIKDVKNGVITYGTTYGVLQMNDFDDHLTIGGDCYIQSYYGEGGSYNDLTAGLLELKGSFYQIAKDNASGSSFNAKENHCVRFTGKSKQVIRFDSDSSGFNMVGESSNVNVAITNGRISTLGASVTLLRYVQYGNMDINGFTLTVTGDMTQKGKVSAHCGTIKVGGSYYQTAGTLTLDGGTLNIAGNYRLQSVGTDENGKTVYGTTYGVLQMNREDDHMIVGGDCYIQSYYGNGVSYNDLYNGLLELKGDFYQIAKDNASGSNFDAGGFHRVTFSGDGVQTVHFDGSGSGFNILTASTNTKINFTNARVSSLDSAVTVTNFVQYGNMTLNGQKLTVLENLTQQGDLYGDGGTLLVNGNYTQVNGTLDINGADITVNGNYRLQSAQENEDGTTTYGTTYGVLKMNDANDHFTIGGNCYIQSYYGDGSSYNDLFDGLLELKGNFYQISKKNASGSNFNAMGQHRVIFTGKTKQVVQFDSDASGFHIVGDSTNKNVALTNARIDRLGASVTFLRYAQYGNMNVSGHTLTVTGNMTQRGNISIDNGMIKVGGSYTQTNGTLDLNGGTLDVTGSYRLQSIGTDDNGKTVYGTTYGVLQMNNAGDHMIVGGDCYIQSYYGEGGGYNDLTNGLLELKGNFYQLTKNGASVSNFNAKDNHKVKFIGTAKQTVRFDGSGSGFNILMAGMNANSNVAIAKGRINSIGETAVLASFTQYGKLNLNGQKLTIIGNFVQTGDVNINGGKLFVKGNYTQSGGTLRLNGGRIEVSKNYRLQSTKIDSDGQTVYTTTYGVLQMTNPADYFLVKGDCYVQSYYGEGGSYNDLSNGVLELKGDFYQLCYDGGSRSNFHAHGQHITVFSDTNPHVIRVEGQPASSFNTVVFTTMTMYDYQKATSLIHYNAVHEPNDPLNASYLTSHTIVTGSKFVVQTRSFGGHAPYAYAVYYGRNTETQFHLLQDYTVADQIALPLVPVGDYIIRIDMQDTAGHISSVYEDLKVVKALENKSMLDSAEVRLGQDIVVRCAAEGGSGEYQYEVSLRNTKDSKFTLVRDYSADSLVRIPTQQEGTFEVLIRVRDTFGKVVKKKIAVTVDNSLVNTSILSSEAVRLGESVTIYASADGGTGAYTYAAYYKKATASNWSTIQGYRDNSMITFKPGAAVMYDVCVKVRDSAGKIQKLYFKVSVTKDLVNQSSVSASSIQLGEKVSLKGAAQYGTGPYTYTYQYKKASTNNWLNIKADTTAASVGLKPASAVAYDIRIIVKDSENTVVEKTFTLNVTK